MPVLEQLESRADELRDALEAGAASMVKAGEIVVKWIDEEGVTCRQIAEALGGGCPHRVISNLEKLGRRKLVPELLFSAFPATAAISRVSYADQTRILEQGVDVVILRENNVVDRLRVSAENLTPQQVKQVFDGPIIRSEAAQRAYLGSASTISEVAKVRPVESGYSVSNGKVMVHGACTLDRKALLRMLTELA